MATYLEIQNDVAALVIDLPTSVQSAVPNLVNQAIRDLQRDYNWRAMEESTVFVTSEGSLDPTPNTIANFKEYRDKGPYLLKQLTRAKRYLTVIDTDKDMAVLSDADLPTEPEFLINSVNHDTGVWTFTIAPYPDANSDWDDGNYRIIVPSYVYSADLSADGDTNWFTQNAADVITYMATAEAFARDWDYDSMAVWLQRAETKLKKLKKADKTNRLSSVDTLVPMWRGANQPQVRR